MEIWKFWHGRRAAKERSVINFASRYAIERVREQMHDGVPPYPVTLTERRVDGINVIDLIPEIAAFVSREAGVRLEHFAEAARGRAELDVEEGITLFFRPQKATETA